MSQPDARITPFSARPSRVPWPPILTLAAIAAGFGLGWLIPLPWPQDQLARDLYYGGCGLIAAAIMIDIWAFWTFRKHATTIRPDAGATNLITSGPFVYSRNPIYVANVMLVTGIGLAAGEAWHVLLALALAVGLQKLAIEREEAHLDARFGATWQAYRKSVRRWL